MSEAAYRADLLKALAERDEAREHRAQWRRHALAMHRPLSALLEYALTYGGMDGHHGMAAEARAALDFALPTGAVERKEGT